MKKITLFVVGILLLASYVFAASVDGTWTSSDDSGMEISYTFKADGSKLTGSCSVSGQDTAISEGKINGKNLSFDVVWEMAGTYKCKGVILSDDEIKITYSTEGDENGTDVIVKRQKK